MSDTLPGSLPWWDARYASGDTPWDTGIVPPEVERLLASGETRSGWALDLGCGTGLTSRYLAQHGFQVVGVDLALTALKQAMTTARSEGLAAHFCLASVTDLSFLRLDATLAVDVGCLHAVPPGLRPQYARGLAGCLAPQAFYLLYAIAPQEPPRPGRPGFSAGELSLFQPEFTVRWIEHGSYRDHVSAWYLLQRAG